MSEELQAHPKWRIEAVPEPPESLSEGAKRQWRGLAPMLVDMGALRGADLPVLGLLCELQADIRRLGDVIRKEGITLEGGSGGKKAHPALRSLTAARRQAQTLLERFGLVPGSRVPYTQRFRSDRQ